MSNYIYQCTACGETFTSNHDQCSKCKANFCIEKLINDPYLDEDEEIFDSGYQEYTVLDD